MILSNHPPPWRVVHIVGGFEIRASNGAQVLRSGLAVRLTEQEARELCELVNGTEKGEPKPGCEYVPQTPVEGGGGPI